MIRVAIVDDERPAAQALERVLVRYGQETGTGFETVYYPSGDAFMKEYRANEFQIVFMDVSMPGTDGIRTSRALREADANVVLIFVTNLAQYAIQGYEVNALDYVLKPVSYYSFRLKIKRALATLNTESSVRFVVSNGDGLWPIRANDLCYIEVRDHDLVYHTKETEIHASGSLKNEEKRLETEPFFRCNYCYLVNLRWVTGVKGNTVVVNGDSLQISRNRKKDFMQRLTALI